MLLNVEMKRAGEPSRGRQAYWGVSEALGTREGPWAGHCDLREVTIASVLFRRPKGERLLWQWQCHVTQRCATELKAAP